ncbi:MAG: NAD(P)(+) transhydrogenase (Re/Si-specific) subunit beta, partial [Planctomycetota bacterium]
MELGQDLRNILYLLAAALFIFGIKGLAHPRTAVRGNLTGAVGMLLAVVVTLIDKQMVGWGWIIAGLVIGAGVGAVLAVKIQMTAMPQLVALYNGFGGIASVFVAGAVLHEFLAKAAEAGVDVTTAIA